VLDTLTRAKTIWESGWNAYALASDLRTLGGAKQLAKTWSQKITADLRAEERIRDENCLAIMDAVEDLTTWELIPDDVLIEGYVWKVDEVTG
jgi:hypothetical protein